MGKDIFINIRNVLNCVLSFFCKNSHQARSKLVKYIHNNLPFGQLKQLLMSFIVIPVVTAMLLIMSKPMGPFSLNMENMGIFDLTGKPVKNVKECAISDQRRI